MSIINRSRSIEEIHNELKAIDEVLKGLFHVELDKYTLAALINDVLQKKVQNYIQERIVDWQPADIVHLIKLIDHDIDAKQIELSSDFVEKKSRTRIKRAEKLN